MSWLSELLGGGSSGDQYMQDFQRQREESLRAQAETEATRQRNIANAKKLAADRLAERKATIAKTADRSSYLSGARDFATEKMKATGLTDAYGLGDYYQKLLATRSAGLPADVDIRQALDPEALYNTAYNDVREGARRNAVSKVNAAVGTDYGRAQFGDTADDAILDSILATQRGSATEAIERARSRGILNDAGYNAAQKSLGERATTARTNLEDVGSGVLSRYRSDLDTEAERLRGRASSLDLTDQFDITGALKGLETRTSGFRGRMEGDIRTAAGDTDYFDIGSLLGKAATDQGFVNPGGAGGILAAFAKDKTADENDPNKRRLVKSTGAF